ncbi:hypothetical protein CDLVIII_0067 [Clostridium sp. DL-VIII]|uniref:hypothetical protein n=1 Tax=Clostridium sp. DL-VIII TaxID=641107 RepID=UPI00023AF6E8|nr:hypothetical protein [Clostridium sp. DL-VIII]EHI96809.1 hypothetical protein CDLVIII_0067 [Clostridium sp. DL-VIII]
MSIYRAKHKGNFTQILNEILTDENLSYGARGLMAYVLAHHDKWTFTGEYYFITKKDKLSKIKGYLKELMEAGYLKRYQEKGNKGEFGKMSYIFYELPEAVLSIAEKPKLVEDKLQKDRYIKQSLKSKELVSEEVIKKKKETEESLIQSELIPKADLPLTVNHTLNNTNNNNTDINNINIYSHWNSKKIIVHKTFSIDIEKAIAKALKSYSEDKIIQAIDVYSEILKSEFYFSYKWSLVDFLSRKNGISTFMEEGSNKVNYEVWKKESEGSGNSKRFTQRDRGVFNEGAEDIRIELPKREFTHYTNEELTEFGID